MTPERAACVIEWRTIPGGDASAEVERLCPHLWRSVIPAMQAVDPRTSFDFDILGALLGMARDPGHPLAQSQLDACNAFLRGSRTSSRQSGVRADTVRAEVHKMPALSAKRHVVGWMLSPC
jgi:hypothetical protein